MRTKIPRSLIRYYKNGVSPDARHTFRELAKNARLDEHYCRNREHLHFLFPTCPHQQHENGKRHHLYRLSDDRPFISSQHEISFMACYHCGYPVDAGIAGNDPMTANR